MLLLIVGGEDRDVERYNTIALDMGCEMASGRPIVASNLSVIREILKDKESAVLFETGDEQNFINAINVALEDKELTQRIARNAQDEVKKYTWSERAKRILSFLNE